MIRTGLIVSAAAIAVMLGAWFWTFDNLPAGMTEAPVHWGINGVADRFAPIAEAKMVYLILPGAGALMALIFAMLPLIDPLRENVRKGERAFLVAWLGTEILLAAIAVGLAVLTVRGTSGGGTDFVRWIIAGTGLFLVLLGDALPKTRRNFFVGVRTPWTLTSDLAWQKTHRLAGWLMVATGLWSIMAAFMFDGAALLIATLAPTFAVVLVSVAYSYLVWRRDPQRGDPWRRLII